MDAPTQSSDARAELALLRRRAYGPDADIAGDSDAVARLAQLESEGTAEPDAASARATEETEPRASAGRVAGEAGVSRPREQARTPPETTRPSKRPRLWWMIAIALASGLLGAGAAVGVTALAAPRPDATLRTVDIDPQTDSTTDGGWPASYLVARNELRAFEEYRGFRAWAGPASDGLVCLFVTHPEIGLVQQSCTAPSIPPVADFAIGNGTVSLGGGPRGIVRFELRGDEVHVFDRYVPDGASERR